MSLSTIPATRKPFAEAASCPAKFDSNKVKLIRSWQKNAKERTPGESFVLLIRELLASKAEREIVAIRPETTLRETAGKLRRQNVSAILVTDTKDKLLGIVSERDLVRAIWKIRRRPVDRPVSEIMTRSVVTCTPADNVLATLSTMNEWAIRHIPVVEAGGIQAMISIREFELACRHLEIQAHTDELTGLSNRRLFMGVLAKEISRFQRFPDPAFSRDAGY